MNNGVAEALLEELLAQSKTQTQLLQKLAKSYTGTGGGGGVGGAAVAAAGLASSFNPLSLAVKAITGGFRLLTGIVSGIVNVFTSLVGATVGVVKNLFEFGKKAMEAGVKLSDFLNVFSDVPILGGLFRLGASLARINEALLEGYRNISGVGATFSGDYMAVTKAAANAGLTISEFSGVIRNNAEIFSMFGGTVQTGVNLFSTSVRKLFSPDSATGISIVGLGVRFDEAANYLAGYMRNLASTGDLERMTTDEVAQAGKNYIIQLDGLARLTGEERKQLDAKMRAARLDQNFQAYLSGLTKEQARVVRTMVETATAISPDLGKEVKARFMGVTGPVTEMGKYFAATNSAFMYDINRFREAMNSGMTEAEAHAAMLELTAKLGINQAELISRQPELLSLGIVNLDGAITGVGMRIRAIMKDGKTFQDAMEIVRKEQEKAGKGSANAMAQTELSMRDLGNAFNQAFLSIGAELIPVVKEFGTMLAKLLKDNILPLVRAAAPLVGRFLNWISDLINTFDKNNPSATFAKIFKDVGDNLTGFWDVIKKPIISAFEKLKDFLTPIFEELMIQLEYYMDRFVDKQMGGINESDEKMRATYRDLELAQSRFRRTDPTDTETFQSRQRDLLMAAEARLATLYKEQGSYVVKGERLASGGFQDESRALANLIASLKVHTQQRHSGTIGMTGNWWEKEDKTVNIQAGETVLTQSQLSQIVDTAGQNTLATEVRKLNTLTAQMLHYLKETADNTKQTIRATRGLSGNIFESV